MQGCQGSYTCERSFFPSSIGAGEKNYVGEKLLCGRKFSNAGDLTQLYTVRL